MIKTKDLMGGRMKQCRSRASYPHAHRRKPRPSKAWTGHPRNCWDALGWATRRVFAAGQAGINVKAAVHDAADTISPERGQAFLEQYGSRPSTWGDAAQLRIQNQSAGFRNTYPNGSPYTGVK